MTSLQSPAEEAELQGLTSTDEALPTPEPETEIEIAAEADHDNDDHDKEARDKHGEAGTDRGTEVLTTAAARLRLSSRPGEDMVIIRCIYEVCSLIIATKGEL